jgi:hypothetical protein
MEYIPGMSLRASQEEELMYVFFIFGGINLYNSLGYCFGCSLYVYICIPFEFDVDSGCDITLCGEVGYDFTNSGARLGDLK